MQPKKNDLHTFKVVSKMLLVSFDFFVFLSKVFAMSATFFQYFREQELTAVVENMKATFNGTSLTQVEP